MQTYYLGNWKVKKEELAECFKKHSKKRTDSCPN